MSEVGQLVEERSELEALNAAGLAPTKTALFVGAPGVGKTLAANWVAASLDLPLMTLNLASVMSSYLGKTGTNLKQVLDFARSNPGVLFLDEIDAVAKRRDDIGDVGELKRLVNVLLQEIDTWPEGTLLLAATNHPDLLDPAIWRRFESVIQFDLPNDEIIRTHLGSVLGGVSLSKDLETALAVSYSASTLSDLQRDVRRVWRASIVTQQPLDEVLWNLVEGQLKALSRTSRIEQSERLLKAGLSQRSVQKLTGTSRDTLRSRGTNEEGRN
ncbi:MAG TPA: ATP-binding protein [Galbitalea sp.]